MAKKQFEVDESIRVGKLTLSEGTIFRCILNRTGEDVRVDLRVWYKTAKMKDFMPTQKGVSLEVEKIDALIRMLEKAKLKIQEMGNE